ncbi:S-adenosyl-L-methionine-dependent methyltransferase [Nemania abortiva]|nr:S-adenosyl-L-methionine-dependent methyltransferase [Nemania abortiva]
MAPDFETQSYWHERFTSEEAYEWLASSRIFFDHVQPYLSESKTDRILQLGSGTSDLHTYLRQRGYSDVTNVDFEPLALERGRALEEAAFSDVQMKYVVADVTRLDVELPALHAFDLVVDKSTADAVSCGGDAALRDMARGVRARLTANGVWISLSYSASRFELDGLPFEVSVIGKLGPAPKGKETDPDVYYWCYLLRPR